jgi:hypothetical protein
MKSPSSTDPAPPPQATLRQTIGVVFCSFFGIRKGNAMQRDAVTIKPHQVIVVGIIFAVLFVATLLLLVRLVISSAAG